MRILLIDDDKALAAMLTQYLSKEGFEVDALDGSGEAVAAALSGQHAAVLLDVMMPGLSGIDVLREIRQRSSIPILMLTAKGDDVDRVIGLEMGADDYIPKPFMSRGIAGATAGGASPRGAGAKPAPDSPAPETLVLRPGRQSASWRGKPLTLTGAEYRLLELLVNAAGEVVSKDELSSKALGRRRASYDRSVDVHINRLRQKLSSASAGAVEIATIRGIGYALESSP